MQNIERAPQRDPDELRTSLLYPLMLIAAIAVIVFSIVGIASLTGVMPRALSSSHGADANGRSPPTARSGTPRKAAPAASEHRSGMREAAGSHITSSAPAGEAATGS